MIHIEAECPFCDVTLHMDVPQYSIDDVERPGVIKVLEGICDRMQDVHLNKHVSEMIEVSNHGPG